MPLIMRPILLSLFPWSISEVVIRLEYGEDMHCDHSNPVKAIQLVKKKNGCSPSLTFGKFLPVVRFLIYVILSNLSKNRTN